MLDLIAAILVGLMAVCAFSLDIVSSPQKSRWMSLPSLIRWQVRVTGGILMVRSVNLFSLAQKPGPLAGQVNLISLACWVCLAATVFSLTLYVLNHRLPAKAWDRISFVLKTMRQQPDTVPVMVKSADVITMHRATGQPAAAGTDPSAVPHELPRFLTMVEHSRERRLRRQG